MRRIKTFYKRNIPLLVLVIATFVLATVFFCGVFALDNKYTWPGPKGSQGVTDLTGEQEREFSYLTWGWEVYENRLLSPQEIAKTEAVPDRYVYLGQYGGFEFGDKSRSPFGSVTYRMTLLLDEEVRRYGLELPEIFSAYRLWINGKLVRSEGDPDPGSYHPFTRTTMETFEASGQVELVFEVSNFGAFYSGMVYPMAFGDPDAIEKAANLKMLVHAAAFFYALFLGMIALLTDLWEKQSGMSKLFFLYCLFFAVYVSYPMIHAIGLGGVGWYLLEKVSLYAMLLLLVILSGKLGKISNLLQGVMFSVGMAVCLMVLLLPFLPMNGNAQVMGLYSSILHYWQKAVAVYLFFVALVNRKKKDGKDGGLICGTVVYGAALWLNGIFTLMEPVYTGWPLEISGLLLVWIIGNYLMRQSRQDYLTRIQIQKQRDVAQQSLELQKQYSEMLSDYLNRTGKRNHEVKKNLELLQYYYNQEEYEELGAHLRKLCQEETGIGMTLYTVNPLINSILTMRCQKAEQRGIQITCDLLGIPSRLPMRDNDLCSLFMNLIDNAIEGAMRVSQTEKRWVEIKAEYQEAYLSILISNAAVEPAVRKNEKIFMTEKSDKMSHGYGMEIIREVVERYHGIEEIQWEQGTFAHQIVLFFRK